MAEEMVDMLKAEERIVEEIKELLWDNVQIKAHIDSVARTYMEGFVDSDGPMTEVQEELFCQYQVVVMNRILAQVIQG